MPSSKRATRASTSTSFVNVTTEEEEHDQLTVEALPVVEHMNVGEDSNHVVDVTTEYHVASSTPIKSGELLEDEGTGDYKFVGIERSSTGRKRRVPRQTPMQGIDGRDVRTMQDLKLLEMEQSSPWVEHVVDGWELVDDFVTPVSCPMCPLLDKPALVLSIYSRRSVLVAPSRMHARRYYTYTSVTRSLTDTSAIDYSCIGCVLTRTKNGLDEEGGKGSTNRLWMRYGRLYGDPDGQHTRSCAPNTIEKTLHTQLNRYLRFLVRSAGHSPRDAYDFVMDNTSAVCADVQVDEQEVFAMFRSFEQMKKELFKDAKKYQEFGPRVNNKNDPQVVGPDQRPIERVQGTRHRPPLKPRPLYGRSKSGVPYMASTVVEMPDGPPAPNATTPQNRKRRATFDEAQHPQHIIIEHDAVGGVDVDGVVVVDGQFYQTVAAPHDETEPEFAQAKLDLFDVLDQALEAYATTTHIAQLAQNIQIMAASPQGFAHLLQTIGEATVDVQNYQAQQQQPHIVVQQHQQPQQLKVIVDGNGSELLEEGVVVDVEGVNHISPGRHVVVTTTAHQTYDSENQPEVVD